MIDYELEIPPKLIPVFAPERGELRYRGAYGGRGSGKSFTFAKMAAIWGAAEPLRILCTRELQNSIKESFHAELKNAIASEPWLDALYDVGVDYIRCDNGTEFIFRGLRHNTSSIKSLAQIDLCIVEEADTVPEESWKALLPTIRAPKSEVWVIWNPGRSGSPTDLRFKKSKPHRSLIAEMNYRDNPWFPKELNEERKNDKLRMDEEEYRHVWEGGYSLAGRGAFKTSWLNEAELNCYEPEKVGDILESGFVSRADGALKIWQMPKAGKRYAIGADIAEGLLHGDFTSIDVLDELGNQVAHWHGHIEPDKAGDVIAKLGKMYNRAFVGVERNNHGLTTLTRLRDLGYQNLYAQENIESRAEGDQTVRFGWLTTRKSKPFIIDNLASLLRDGESGLASVKHIDEMRQYIIEENGSYNASEGEHDDRIMSYAIALEMQRRMPRGAIVTQQQVKTTSAGY